MRVPPRGSFAGPSRHSAPDLAGPSPLVQPEHRGSAPRALWLLPDSPAPEVCLPHVVLCQVWVLRWSQGGRRAISGDKALLSVLLVSGPLGPGTGSDRPCAWRSLWERRVAGRQAGGAASVEASWGGFLKGGGCAAQAKAWPHVSPRERAVGGPWSLLRGAGGRHTLRKPRPTHPGPRRPSELVTTPAARSRRTSLMWGAGAGSGGGEPSWGTPRSHSGPLAASQADLA